VAPGENDDEKSWFDIAILVYAPNLWIQFFSAIYFQQTKLIGLLPNFVLKP
jgi:hypothetical protein